MTRKKLLSSMLITFIMGIYQTVLAIDIEYIDPSGGRAPFSNPVRVGDMLYLSGSLGFKDGKLVPGGIGPETVAALANIKRVLEANGSSMDQVIKCTLFLTDMADYLVMNAEYTKVFVSNKPARSGIGVRNLFAGAHIEIECMAWVETD